MRERVRLIMADVFDIDPAELPANLSIENVEAWDSLRHLQLMLDLEHEFGIEISTELMPDLLSLDAIEAYLRAEVRA